MQIKGGNWRLRRGNSPNHSIERARPFAMRTLFKERSNLLENNLFYAQKKGDGVAISTEMVNGKVPSRLPSYLSVSVSLSSIRPLSRPILSPMSPSISPCRSESVVVTPDEQKKQHPTIRLMKWEDQWVQSAPEQAHYIITNVPECSKNQ